MGTDFQEFHQRSVSSPNRWGDPPAGTLHRVSHLAVAAIGIAAASFVAGPLHLMIAASWVHPGWSSPLPAMVRLIGLALFPVGMILSYLALLHCRLDRPFRGRGLAWGALAISYISLGVWEAALTGLSSSGGLWLFYAILLVAGIHLVVFAAESTAGKYVLLSLILGGTLLSLLSLWALQSREAARRVQTGDNLRKMGMELHHQWELQRQRPQPQGGAGER